MEAEQPASENLNKAPLYRTWWKVWPFPRCCLPCNVVLHPCRAAVSQKKTRFRQDGFDLDLTYVTNRIIVHGFPATGVEHIYRNPRTEVKRLLDKYHSDHYKVYNFTNEPGRTYPAQFFDGRVERYPFSDHTCPPLESVVDFCENAKAWLDTDEANVVSLHCKAGKGRAGIMAACLMVRMGHTADAAVRDFDEKRAYDTKGLTVVNQRKWVYMYERLVREVWGLQDSIAMVPGRDPGLSAPSARAASVREISVQFEAKAEGKGGGEAVSLPNLMCTVYQQRPMGKALVHRAKMVQVVPLDGEPQVVWVADLPRSAWIQGTFQVMVSAAMGAVPKQKTVMDLWWSTTFLDNDGGKQTFEVEEMDVFPAKLAERLRRARARIVVQHTHPDAETPPRRQPLLPTRARSHSSAANPDSALELEGPEGTVEPEAPPEEEDDADEPSIMARGLLNHSQEESLPLRSDGSMRPALGKGDGSIRNGVSSNGIETAEQVVDHPRDADGKSLAATSDSNDAEGGSSKGVAGASETRPARESGDFTLKAASYGSGAGSQGSGVPPQETGGKSPSLPGPSPAGWASPAWTFEGRLPSSGGALPVDDRKGHGEWRQRRMWSSGQLDDVSTSPAHQDVVPEKHELAHGDRGSGVADRRNTLPQRSSQDWSDLAVAPTGRVPVPKPLPPFATVATAANMGSIPAKPDGAAFHPRQGARAYGRREQGYGLPPYETESDSDDQLAVRASAFGGTGVAAHEAHLHHHQHQHQHQHPHQHQHHQQQQQQYPDKVLYHASFGHGPVVASARSRQWMVDMEMAFEQERARWLEHRRCLETELDWALAARARAEARSEEDSARVEVLEKRLSVWRGEYAMIEQDVKQALPLLEMSLSGLLSAENALKRWKEQIPSKAYEDVMSCLTNGDTSFTRS